MVSSWIYFIKVHIVVTPFLRLKELEVTVVPLCNVQPFLFINKKVAGLCLWRYLTHFLCQIYYRYLPEQL